MKNLRVIFMGTPIFSKPILEMLIKETNVIMVVTQPDAIIGRKKELKPCPIKELALNNNIEVFSPLKIRNEYEPIINLKPDIIITCAYGQIIPKEILDCPKLGCINVHASLLPKLRGGAPIHHALIDGYKKTGITIMYMDEKMDNGDIISQKEYIIKDSDNVGTLHDILSEMGKNLLLDALPSIIDKTNQRIKQNENEVTFGFNIKREEELIDFNDSSLNIYNKVRGLNPWPMAYTIINGEETKILECKIDNYQGKELPGTIIDINKDNFSVKTLDGKIIVTKLKPFGKKIMSTKDYLNGLKNKDSIKITPEV